MYFKANDLQNPGPSTVFTFIDQREDSVNMGNFMVGMAGYQPTQPASYAFWDMPASYHNRSGGLSFADGHSEMRRWVDGRTFPVKVPAGASSTVPSPGNVDVAWLQDHATRPK
jgi:prepilin-type processing-associated H-X9-DG protein